ncbi:MAG: ABC transporter permease [Spirochaetaceae bacterium]|nr:ABC transporter permease [Spirochaetaceae bacterium]
MSTSAEPPPQVSAQPAAAVRMRWREKLSPWVMTVAGFLLWEAVCRVFRIPTYVLPPPTLILSTFSEFRRALFVNSLQTLWTTLAGFGIAVGFGLLLGLIIGWSKTIYNGLYPIMIGFNCVPKVAVVPILVLWFGIGSPPAILTAFLISFFPIVVNVATGLATLEPELEDVLRALGAHRRDIMLKVGIPRALPYFFGSLKVAITLAFVGSVISETVAANVGIGHMLLIAQANFEVPLVFAGLWALAVEGIGMYAAFAWLERRLTGWAFRRDAANA